MLGPDVGEILKSLRGLQPSGSALAVIGAAVGAFVGLTIGGGQETMLLIGAILGFLAVRIAVSAIAWGIRRFRKHKKFRRCCYNAALGISQQPQIFTKSNRRERLN